MYNVVFTTNFSNDNKKIVTEFINQFTPTMNVEVEYYMVHAFELPKVGQHMMIDIDDSLEKNAKEDMESYLEDIKQNISENIKITPYIRQGSFESVLHKFDKEIEINLLVLIETKNSAFKEVLSEKNLSSLSESIGEPILFLPTNPNYVIPKKVTFATDLKPFDNEGDFRNFLGFIKHSGASVEFLHVAKEKGDHYALFQDIFGKVLAEYDMEEVPFTLLNNKDVNKSIINYIDTEKPEMIALVERGDSFYEKWFVKQTVDVLSKYINLPLFVIFEKFDTTKRKGKS